MGRFTDDERRVLLAISKAGPRPAKITSKAQRECAERLAKGRLVECIAGVRGATYKLSESGRCALMASGVWPGPFPRRVQH